MIRIIWILISISTLFGCKKNNSFVPCEDFDKMYGTWRAIDGQEEHNIVINRLGEYINYYPLERTIKYQMLSVSKISLQINEYGSTYNSFLADVEDLNEHTFIIHFTNTFDTILGGGAAYNNVGDDQYTIKRFVKVK